MSRIITTTVYTLDELSCPAQEKARDGYRLRIFMKGDHSITSIEIG
ncbi:hypothetical protein [Escherichia coli]|nr:hypothetical protein [Escherichia coli]SQR00048.1 antitoxin of the YeeV-YeeU toxin-antitoxin system [Escherichia coli]